jgi:hypothetical protein
VETGNHSKTGRHRKARRVGNNLNPNKMKSKLFIIPVIIVAIVFFSLRANAQTQPQNAGFETWEVIGNGEDPLNWSSFNEYSILYHVPVMSFKTTDAHTGTYALRVISDTATIPPPLGTNVLDTVMGMVILGNLDLNHPGIPYTDKPISISAYVKGTVKPNGVMYMMAQLSRWNTVSHQRDIVGQAIYAMNASIASYTKVTVPITYTFSYTPDTLVLQILTGNGGSNGFIMPGNELFIDDISFSGLVGINEKSNDISINIFPNPCHGFFNIQSNIINSKIEIMNMLGEKVYSAPLFPMTLGKDNAAIDLSKQPKGVYFYRVMGEKEILKTGKIIIE